MAPRSMAFDLYTLNTRLENRRAGKPRAPWLPEALRKGYILTKYPGDLAQRPLERFFVQVKCCFNLIVSIDSVQRNALAAREHARFWIRLQPKPSTGSVQKLESMSLNRIDLMILYGKRLNVK